MRQKRLYKNKYMVDTFRKDWWDYRDPGPYFITICTENRKWHFGEVHNGQMCLSDMGQVAAEFWRETPKHFPHVMLDEWVVMPNHVHMLFALDVKPFPGPPPKRRFGPLQPGSVPKIIQAYKAAVTRWCNRNGHTKFGWQDLYHDSIVLHPDKSIPRIRRYIQNNPATWWRDRNR